MNADSTGSIPYNVPTVTGHEQAYLAQVFESGRFAGPGAFTRKCEALLEKQLGAHKVLLTPSCTAALEMSALLLEVKPDDEVIMPSFTFVSCANAFALRGATIVFVDVDPRTMNIDPECVRAAISPRTRAIVPVHYAGVGCDMDALVAIASQHGVAIVEDAAQGLAAAYKGRPLGTFGALGCISFHETKNLHCGEGGALVINDPGLAARAEIIREKGTNRTRFLRGEVDKYTWVDIGSSYLASELNAAFLLAQLEACDRITAQRLALWQRYAAAFSGWNGERPDPPGDRAHNGHIYWAKLKDQQARDAAIGGLRAAGIQAPFHFVPLHSTELGGRLGRFQGPDRHTSDGAGRLLRLPLHASLSPGDQDRVIDCLRKLVE